MFVTEKLVFLETQKTGSTHIRRLLERYTEGKSVGKHNRLTDNYADRFIVSSIRNPWDWYVSLWAFGVSGKGAIRNRCLNGVDFSYYHRELPKNMGKNWLTPTEFFVSLYHDAAKPISNWRRYYADASSPECFRGWLGMLLDSKRRFDFGEGYGFSPLSLHSGLLTYRYFRLNSRGNHVFKDQRLQHYDGVAAFDHDFSIVNDMIKLESLEEDFIRIMGKAGYCLSVQDLDELRNRQRGKTNVSKRESSSFYYDDASIELVARKDRYLIEKYGYTPSF